MSAIRFKERQEGGAEPWPQHVSEEAQICNYAKYCPWKLKVHDLSRRLQPVKFFFFNFTLYL